MAGCTSRSARIALRISTFGAVSALGGIVGVQAGVLTPMLGFLLFVLGTLPCGLAALITGAWALAKARQRFEPSDRRAAWRAVGLAVTLLVLVAMAARQGSDVPAINDITTNLAEPPSFASAAEVPAYAGRDMSYPADFADPTRAAYPDLRPLHVSLARDQAFKQALRTAYELGWKISYRDPEAGRFDATATTFVFRFVDDIAVRVRANGEAALIDVRSKSRDGRGDLGTNAARIRAFGARLQQAPVN